MLHSGKFILIGMLLMAVGMAGFALWYRYASTRRTMEFWGPEAAELISRSSGAQLLVLEPEVDNLTILESPIGYLQLRGREDLTQVRGFTHVRAALIEDRSFAWDEPTHGEPEWQYGLRFFEPDENGAGSSEREVLVLLDLNPESPRAMRQSGDRAVSIRPIAGALRNFVSQFEPLEETIAAE